MFRKFFPKDKAFYTTLGALAIPLMIQSVINQSLTLIDTFMVGTLGDEQFSGVSLANAIFLIITLTMMGIQSGGAVLISQYWGKNDRKTINRVIGASFYVAGIFSVVVSTAIFLFPNQIFGFMTDEPALLMYAVKYGKVVCFSYVLNAFSLVYIGAQRSTGNPRFGMTLLFISTGVNTFLNWVLIFGNLGAPAMGVEGAALATFASRVVEFLICVIYSRRDDRLPLDFAAILRPGKEVFKDFSRYAGPVVLNEALWAFGFSIYPMVFGHMTGATDIVAAYTISENVARIINVGGFGMSGSSAIIIGRAIGEGKPKDEVYAMSRSILAVGVVMSAVGALFLFLIIGTLFPVFLYPMFKLSENARQIANFMFLLICGTLMFRTFNFVNLVGVLRGGGDVNGSMAIDLGVMYGYAIPAAILSGLVFRANIYVVYTLIQMENFLKAAVGIRRFVSRKWIRNITREFEPAPPENGT